MIALFVEGMTEKLVIQKICPGIPIKIINNGKDVSPLIIAKQIATLFRLLNNRHYPVVVILDREERALTADEFAAQIVGCLSRLEIPTDQIILAIPDRMIENWILADPNCSPCISADEEYEGTDGKSVLTRLLGTIDTKYHGPTVGVDLLCSINPTAAAARSTSFNSFVQRMRPFCRWVRPAGEQN